MTDLTRLERDIVAKVARHEAPSRAELSRALGVVRSTIAVHVDHLVTAGLLAEGAPQPVERGRPPAPLRLGPAVGIAVGIAFQHTSVAVALSDGYGALLDRAETAIEPDHEPDEAVTVAASLADGLLTSRGLDRTAIRAVVAGVSAPVDIAEGAASYRAILPKWLHWPLRARLADLFEAIAVVDNDANLSAGGAAASLGESALPLLYLHLSVGVGAGLIGADGELYRGADGSAGDIGHLRLAGSADIPCECGRRGCIGAVIGLKNVLDAAGVISPQTPSITTALERMRRPEVLGDPAVTRAIRDAGENAGALSAALVDAFNPRTLVLGGELVELSEQLTAAIRSRVYSEALPVATHRLAILPADTGAPLALLGAARTAARILLHQRAGD